MATSLKLLIIIPMLISYINSLKSTIKLIEYYYQGIQFIKPYKPAQQTWHNTNIEAAVLKMFYKISANDYYIRVSQLYTHQRKYFVS